MQPFPFTAKIDPSSRSGSLVLTFCPKENFRTWISVPLKYGQSFKRPLTHFFPISPLVLFLDDVQLFFGPKATSFKYWLPSFSRGWLLNVSVSARLSFASIPSMAPIHWWKFCVSSSIVFIKHRWADETVLNYLKSHFRYWGYTFNECRKCLVIDPCSQALMVVHLLHPIHLPWTKT